MSALAILLLQNLPKILDAAKLLAQVPGAVESAKELYTLAKELKTILERDEPFTPEELAKLSETFESHITAVEYQNPEVVPPQS